MNNLYKIKNKQGQIIKFKPNYIQLRHLAERGSHRRNLILKARQFGVTTLYCIDMLDEALWVQGMSCAIIAHERSTLDKIFEIVKRAYENIPNEIKPQTRSDTTREYKFDQRYDGVKMDSSIYVALKVRGGTVQRLHITESAYIRDRQELDAGSKQAVPIDGWITEETTGNGFNTFYDTYMEAYENPEPEELDYRAFFYAWFEHPEYTLPVSKPLDTKSAKELEIQKKYNLSDGQLLWRRWKMDELKRSSHGTGLSGEQLFMQEYPASVMEAFQSGAGNVFDSELIEQVNTPDPLSLESAMQLVTPEQQEALQSLYKQGVKFWEVPQAGKDYVIGVDPSDGQGADYGVIDVWCGDDQIAQFQGKLLPNELAELSVDLGYFFNEALLGVENNMLSTILWVAQELKYPNYYYTRKVDEKTSKKTKKIGWNTNSKTRNVMIDDFLIRFEDDALNIRSPLTLSQMRTFVTKDNGKREHADGKFDDALFAGMIAVQMNKHNKPRTRTWSNKPW